MVKEERQKLLKKLKHLRETRGWTQMELARKLNCRPETINRWMKDESNVSNVYITIITKFLESEADL